jgi:hypothetical protein
LTNDTNSNVAFTTQEGGLITVTDDADVLPKSPLGVSVSNLRLNHSIKLSLTLEEAEQFGWQLMRHASAVRVRLARLAGVGILALVLFIGCAPEGLHQNNAQAAAGPHRGPSWSTPVGEPTPAVGVPEPPAPETTVKPVSVPVEPPRVVTPPDAGSTSPDTRAETWTRSAEVTTTLVDPTPDARPDVWTPSADVTPPRDAYINDAGWGPYLPDGGEQHCCLPCGNYPGCVMLVHTTPFCRVTAGSYCLTGGTGPDSVWPRCLPPVSPGACL